MSSFFSRIQSYFNADNTGRYVGIILLEIISEDPSVLTCLFGDDGRLARNVKAKKWKPVIEWRFLSSKNRKADLAIVNIEDENECFALLEVKAEDKELPNQFSDYQQFVAEQKKIFNRKVEFTVFSKYLDPRTVDSKSIGPASFNLITYAQLAQNLLDRKSDRHPAVNLFIDYVKDMGLMFNNIQQNDMRLLLWKLLFGRRGGGRIRSKENIREIIPNTFSSVIGNQFVLSEKLKSKFGGYRSTIDFTIELDVENGKIYENDYLTKKGGYLYTYTDVPLITTANSDDWLYLTYGLSYEVDSSDTDRVLLQGSASISGKKLSQHPMAEDGENYVEEFSKPMAFSTNYKPEKLQGLIEKEIRAVIHKVLSPDEKSTSYKLPSNYEKALNKLSF